MRWCTVRSGCWCGSPGYPGSTSKRARRSSARNARLASELPVDGLADLPQGAAASRQLRRQQRFPRADVAVGAVLALETREQRAVADRPRAVAVAVDPIEHGGGPARRRVRFSGGGG